MWRCNNCHSTAVEGLGWVELNSRTSVGDVLGDDSDDFWCSACETHTTIYFKDEPDEDYLTEEAEDGLIDFDDDFNPELPNDLPRNTEPSS